MGLKPVMLSLFDHSTVMARPWAMDGYECICVDEKHPEGDQVDKNGIHRVGTDILTWIPERDIVERVQFIAAFPPCTHLAVSGARHFVSKGLAKFEEAISLVGRAKMWCEWFDVPFMIENPVGTLSSYWRKPDFIFHPYEYAQSVSPPPAWVSGDKMYDERYTKKTCLWTGGGFNMPPPIKLPAGVKPDDRIHKMAPSAKRAAERGKTPAGFAIEVWRSNRDDSSQRDVSDHRGPNAA